MKKVVFLPLFLALLGTLTVAFTPQTGNQVDESKVIVVDLDIKSPADARRAFSSEFDRARVEMDLSQEDLMFKMENYSMVEEPLVGPDCFLPQIKFILREDTYVFSLYCTSVIRYRNSAPFETSSRVVESDITVTESVLDYIQEIHKKYFGGAFDPAVAARFHKTTSLKELNQPVDDSMFFEDDETGFDQVLERDAIDKEGWFDEIEDPGLEIEDENDDD